MNNKSIKNLIVIAFALFGITAGGAIANAQAYLPSGYSGNYTPVYNGPVVSQPVAYANNYDQIAYNNNNQIYTGFGGGTVVSNVYDNNSNNYNNYNQSNDSEIYAFGNPNGPTVSSAGNSNSGSQNQNSIGLSVDTYSANGVGFSGSTMNGGFVVNNPISNTTVWFEYGQSVSTLNQKTVGETFYTTSGSFSKAVYGLKSNTTYYFRAVAQNGQNVAKGDILTFKTSKVTGSSGGNTVSGNTGNGEVLGDSEVIQEEEMDRSNLGALAFWSGFFPSSALGWIIIILIILILIVLARRYREKKAHGAHH